MSNALEERKKNEIYFSDLFFRWQRNLKCIFKYNTVYYVSLYLLQYNNITIGYSNKIIE